jgi:hypothetical protein
VVDPNLRSDRAPVVWLPHLNPATVVITPAPDEFADARPISELTPAFSRRTMNGEHWLLDQGCDALHAFIDGGELNRPAAIVIPLDGSFDARIRAALRLKRAMMGRAPSRAPDNLTSQQRTRLGLILRSLDGQLAGYSRRSIAEVLFGPNCTSGGSEWKTHHLRARTDRMCRRGVELMRGAYLKLLYHQRQFRD